MNETLGKEYKLCSKKIITAIFENKQRVKQFPLVAMFQITELPTNTAFQIVFSAPKRTFRKAHDRNRIKRLCKETVRKNKSILEEYLNQVQQQLALFLVYSHSEELPYEVLFKKNKQLFEQIVVELQKHHTSLITNTHETSL
jgi:ribonuclease P protein component